MDVLHLSFSNYTYVFDTRLLYFKIRLSVAMYNNYLPLLLYLNEILHYDLV